MAEGKKIGGYWTSLKLISDKNSFDKGKKALKEIGNDVKGFAKTIAKLGSLGAGGLVGFVATMSSLERRSGLLAKSLSVSGMELTSWRNTANVAGISADNLTSSMLDLEKKVNRMQLGEVDVNLAKSLGMMGVDFGKFNNASSTDRMSLVMEKAMSMKNKKTAGELVRNVLGDAGKDMFTYLQMSDRKLSDILAESRALTFTTDASKKKAMEFDVEMKAVMNSGKEVLALFGSELAGELTPLVRGIKQWTISNRELIKTNIKGFAKDLGRLIRDIYNTVKKTVPIIQAFVSKMGGLSGIAKKVAMGFAIFTTGKLVFGIINVVKGLGGVAAALRGLGLVATVGAPQLLAIAAAIGAIWLIADDIIGYFQGKDSVMGMVVEYFSKLGDSMLKGMSPEARKALKDFLELMQKLAPIMGDLGLDMIKNTFMSIDEITRGIANTITWIFNVIGAFRSGKGFEYIIDSVKEEKDKLFNSFKEGYKAGGIPEALSRIQKDNPEWSLNPFNQLTTLGARSVQSGAEFLNKVRIEIIGDKEHVKSVSVNNQKLSQLKSPTLEYNMRMQQMGMVGR
jgi:hypothetical protein